MPTKQEKGKTVEWLRFSALECLLAAETEISSLPLLVKVLNNPCTWLKLDGVSSLNRNRYRSLE